jgi:hypothetical protein
MNLDPQDYWKLRAVNSDLERDQATLMAIQSRLDATRVKRQAVWDALAAKYSLDPTAQYAAKDEDCSLNVQTNGQPAT